MSTSSVGAQAPFHPAEQPTEFGAQRRARQAFERNVDLQTDAVEKNSSRMAAQGTFKVMATANAMLGSLVDLKT